MESFSEITWSLFVPNLDKYSNIRSQANGISSTNFSGGSTWCVARSLGFSNIFFFKLFDWLLKFYRTPQFSSKYFYVINTSNRFPMFGQYSFSRFMFNMRHFICSIWVTRLVMFPEFREEAAIANAVALRRSPPRRSSNFIDRRNGGIEWSVCNCASATIAVSDCAQHRCTINAKQQTIELKKKTYF